jgi:hypothetical protein
VPLPPAPIPGRDAPGTAWTGNQMLVWGGAQEVRTRRLQPDPCRRCELHAGDPTLAGAAIRVRYALLHLDQFWAAAAVRNFAAAFSFPLIWER